MLTYLQAMILGAVQGVTELFPVSSLGHSVLLPSLLGWNIDQGADSFLTFLVATHFATALVLFVYFWKDWKRIVWGLLCSIKNIKIAGDADARLGWLLVLGTVPAGAPRPSFPKQDPGPVRQARICRYFSLFLGTASSFLPWRG